MDEPYPAVDSGVAEVVLLLDLAHRLAVVVQLDDLPLEGLVELPGVLRVSHKMFLSANVRCPSVDCLRKYSKSRYDWVGHGLPPSMIEFDTQIIPTARAMSFLFSGRVQLSKCAQSFSLPYSVIGTLSFAAIFLRIALSWWDVRLPNMIRLIGHSLVA